MLMILEYFYVEFANLGGRLGGRPTCSIKKVVNYKLLLSHPAHPQVGKLYFYVERVGGSDDFFQNKLIAANNILTILAMVGLLISAINLIYDNTRQEMEQRCTVWKKLNKQAD